MVINPYWLWESEVSSEICDQLIKEVDWKSKQPGLVGEVGPGMLDLKMRKTNIVFERWTKTIGSILFSHIYSANISAGWNFKIRYPQDTQIGAYSYSDKGHYDWHKDLGSPNEENIQRKLSASFILSNPQDYEGGELLLRPEKEELKFKLPKGSIIVFPSFIEHKVNMVTSGERYSAVMWVDGPAFV